MRLATRDEGARMRVATRDEGAWGVSCPSACREGGKGKDGHLRCRAVGAEQSIHPGCAMRCREERLSGTKHPGAFDDPHWRCADVPTCRANCSATRLI